MFRYSAIDFLIISIASFSFATAIQMLRGNFINFKPFNCKFCLSFWFSTIVFFYNNPYDVIQNIVLSFAVSGVCYIIKLIEDRTGKDPLGIT